MPRKCIANAVCGYSQVASVLFLKEKTEVSLPFGRVASVFQFVRLTNINILLSWITRYYLSVKDA